MEKKKPRNNTLFFGRAVKTDTKVLIYAQHGACILWPPSLVGLTHIPQVIQFSKEGNLCSWNILHHDFCPGNKKVFCKVGSHIAKLCMFSPTASPFCGQSV